MFKKIFFMIFLRQRDSMKLFVENRRKARCEGLGWMYILILSGIYIEKEVGGESFISACDSAELKSEFSVFDYRDKKP